MEIRHTKYFFIILNTNRLCSNLHQKSKIIQPGSFAITTSKGGTNYIKFGNDQYWNARSEKLDSYLKNFDPCFITCDSFREGNGFFAIPPLDELKIACVENEDYFLILTQPSTGSIIEKYHPRMPFVLRNETSFLQKGIIEEYPHTLLKLVA